jgi:hypothetical protein
MDQGIRTRPATAADFHRLADLAHERGLQLFRDGQRWYCSSASDRGGCHYVTGFSCDCQGFIAHQRCTHHALLLERLGWLPEIEGEKPVPVLTEPVKTRASTPQSCFWCLGSGRTPNDHHERFDHCEPCGGTGVRQDRRLAGQPAVQPVATAA